MVFEGLEKISGERLYTYIFVLLGLLLPGLIYLYNFKYDLFMDVSFGKLILLCILFSFPIFMLGLLVEVVGNNKKKWGNQIFQVLLGASVSAVIISFISYVTFLGVKESYTEIDFIYWYYFFSLVISFGMILLMRIMAYIRIRISNKDK